MSAQPDLGWAGCSAVERDPQRVSRTWVFRGTRIPVAALFENLKDGVSLQELQGGGQHLFKPPAAWSISRTIKYIRKTMPTTSLSCYSAAISLLDLGS
jgi:hypothetical protein